MRAAKRFGFLSTAVAVILLVPPGPLESQSDGPQLRLSLSYDVVIRGDRCWVGQYDKDGNFIPDATHWSFRSNAGPLGGPVTLKFAHQANGPSASAEHRSGRLILGTMVNRVFVPEIGSKVLDIQNDFNVKKPDRIVYNMYETAFAFYAEGRKKQKEPKPPAAGVPEGCKLVPFREAFPHSPEERNAWFAHVIDEVMEFGHLSDEGEFIPEYGLPVMPYVKAKNGTRVELPDGGRRSFYYTLPHDGAWGRREVDEEEVFEFRSGRLIKGKLQKTGNFVPEIGSKILDFKDYDPYSRRRIYNLPGVLRPVKK